MKQADSLIEEGTKCLDAALRKGILSELQVAKLLIESVREKLVTTREQ